jgi:hypothetical protein
MRDLYASVALAYTIPIAKGNSGDKTAISKPQGHQTLEDMAVPKKVSSQTSCLEWFSSFYPIHRDCMHSYLHSICYSQFLASLNMHLRVQVLFTTSLISLRDVW